MLRCGNLLGQKAVRSNHDVICRESTWIQYKANSKQFLLEPATGRVDFFIKKRLRELGRKNSSMVGCLPSMLKALGSTPSTAKTKFRTGRMIAELTLSNYVLGTHMHSPCPSVCMNIRTMRQVFLPEFSTSYQRDHFYYSVFTLELFPSSGLEKKISSCSHSKSAMTWSEHSRAGLETDI